MDKREKNAGEWQEREGEGGLSREKEGEREKGKMKREDGETDGRHCGCYCGTPSRQPQTEPRRSPVSLKEENRISVLLRTVSTVHPNTILSQIIALYNIFIWTRIATITVVLTPVTKSRSTSISIIPSCRNYIHASGIKALRHQPKWQHRLPKLTSSY